MSKLESCMETANIINETQDLILNGLPIDGQRVNLPAWVGSIKVVAESPEGVTKAVLGDTGLRLQRFALRINLDHPDLEAYFDTLGKAAIEMFVAAADVLVAAAFDKTQGKDLANVEADFLAVESWVKVIRVLGNPRPRLLVGLEDRKNQRYIKKNVNCVSLKTIFQSGENAFFGRPLHFKRFARGSKYYQEEMKELQVRQALFVARGMNEMSHAYAKRMRILEESTSEMLGFYRIKPDEAVVILARLHGFKWNELGTVTVNSKHFAGCRFWAENSTAASDENKTEALKKALILNTQFVPTSVGALYFNYQPRMYPLPMWNTKVALPDRVQKIIDRSEHFAFLNQAPFFDYYWVLVPGISVANPLIQKTKDQYTIREGSVNVIYLDQHEAAFSLDAMLVKEGYLTPVVIGEKDGRCFFVGMWI